MPIQYRWQHQKSDDPSVWKQIPDEWCVVEGMKWADLLKLFQSQFNIYEKIEKKDYAGYDGKRPTAKQVRNMGRIVGYRITLQDEPAQLLTPNDWLSMNACLVLKRLPLQK